MINIFYILLISNSLLYLELFYLKKRWLTAMKKNEINDSIPEILKEYRKIAVVGISTKPERDSHSIAKFMQLQGYQIYPVNPNYEKVLGETCYPGLSDLPDQVDLVDIFRKPDQVMPVVEEAIKIGAKAIWMQLGVVNSEAAKVALDAGLKVVMNRCWKIEYINHMNLLK